MGHQLSELVLIQTVEVSPHCYLLRNRDTQFLSDQRMNFLHLFSILILRVVVGLFLVFRCPLMSLLVVTSTSSMYARNMGNPLNSSDIFSWKILGLFKTPIGNFWYSHSPQGSTVVQICLDPCGIYIY